MAGYFMSLVMQGMQGADPSAKLVAVALAEFAQVKDGGVAYPSIARLVACTGVGERQVRQHLRWLQANGWITPEGATHGGRGMSTRYRLNLGKLRACSKPGSLPQGIDDDKPGDAPQGKLSTNPAVDDSVSENKPGGAASETLRPTALNPAAHRPRTGFDSFMNRGNASGQSLGEVLRTALPHLKKDDPEQVKGGNANGIATVSESKPRTREEQLAYVDEQLRKIKGEG